MATAKDTADQIMTWLAANPGEHDLDAIAAGADATEAQARRALTRLTRDGKVRHSGEGDDARWSHPDAETSRAATADAESAGQEPDSVPEPDPEPGTAPPAEQDDLGGDETDPDTTETDQPEPSTGTAAGDQESDGEPAAEEDGPGEDRDDDTEPAPTQGKEGEEEEEEEEAVEPAAEPEPLPDPDPQVLHIARTIADTESAFTLQALCDRAYLPTKRRLVLNTLRAMAAHGLVECSHPFDPESSEAIWEVVYDGALMDAAIRVQLADAPDQVTCTHCGQTKTFGGAPRPRPRQGGTGVRNDGQQYLAPGELTGFVIDWVTDPQNTGEEITVRQLNKELADLHPGKVKANADGAIKNALDRMCRPDHRRLRYPEKSLVALVRETGPRTYRCLGV